MAEVAVDGPLRSLVRLPEKDAQGSAKVLRKGRARRSEVGRRPELWAVPAFFHFSPALT